MTSFHDTSAVPAAHGNDGFLRNLRPLLRIEAVAVLGVSVAAYAVSGQPWVLFGLLFFVPDISMAGYIGGPRIGARIYNVGHSYVLPLTLLGLALLAFGPASTQAAVAYVWLAHIGFDRSLGYGLKDIVGFHATHLGTIGRAGSRRAAN